MARINLKELQRQRISRDIRGKFILLYGLPGVGKTSLAAQFPNVLIVGFEQGTNGIDNAYVAQMQSWGDFDDLVRQLVRDPEIKEKYHCIAIDTADEAWAMCERSVCAEHNVTSIGDIGYGKGYNETSKKYHDAMQLLTKAGYGVVFTAHSVEKTYKNEKGQEYPYLQPALDRRPFDIINKMVDIIAYIREISIDDGKETKRERFMYLRDEQGERFLAKSRFKYMPSRIPLSYSALVNAIQEACDKQAAENGSTATDDANPYTKLDFDALIEEAKMLWGQVLQKDKNEEAQDILRAIFGKPTKFSEILPDEVDKLNQAIIDIKAIL